jgi:hypothetical protein
VAEAEATSREEGAMQTNSLTLGETRMLIRALDCLAKEVRASKDEPKGVDKALGEVAALKGKLEAGEYCEAGSEEICASTRLGVFW